MDDLYFHTLKLDCKYCANCKHIDWQGCLVSNADESYHGYDGTYFCNNTKESERGEISALWPVCTNGFEEKTSDDYINEMTEHILFALDTFEKEPDRCSGKSRNEVIRNVLINYRETIASLFEIR